MDNQQYYHVNCFTFMKALKFAFHAVAIRASRPSLEGLCIEVKDGDMRLIGTDGYRLAVACLQPKEGHEWPDTEITLTREDVKLLIDNIKESVKDLDRLITLRVECEDNGEVVTAHIEGYVLTRIPLNYIRWRSGAREHRVYKPADIETGVCMQYIQQAAAAMLHLSSRKHKGGYLHVESEGRAPSAADCIIAFRVAPPPEHSSLKEAYIKIMPMRLK